VSNSRRTLYVALGDGFSCATGPGLAKAWPDLVGDLLGPHVTCANFATTRATSVDVERDQVPLALGLQPEIVSVTCGANDLIVSARPDIEGFAARFERILDRLSKGLSGAVIVTATYPDLSSVVAIGRRTKRRLKQGGEALNARIRELADQHGALLLDWAAEPPANSPALGGWDPPRRAQEAAAAEVVRRLGPHWRAPDG
jgi:lysophospholipase L1-like esterase